MSANAQTPGSGEIDTFDALPPRLRQALREFPLNMSSEFALAQLRSGKTEDQLLALLETQRRRLGEFNPKA